MRKERGRIVALVLMVLALILSLGLGIVMSRRAQEEVAAERDRKAREAREAAEQLLRARSARGGARPVLGVHVVEAKGAIVVRGVVPGRPAAAGGMKTGDVIIRIGEHSVRGIEDVGQAMKLVTTGDEVRIVVDRNGSQLSLPVVLGEPSPR